MIDREEQRLPFGENVAVMVFGQNDRGSDRSVDAVVDGSDLSELDRLQRRMEQSAVQTFVVRRASGRRRHAQPIPTKRFKERIVDAYIGNERSGRTFEGAFIECEIGRRLMRRLNLYVKKRVFDDQFFDGGVCRHQVGERDEFIGIPVGIKTEMARMDPNKRGIEQRLLKLMECMQHRTIASDRHNDVGHLFIPQQMGAMGYGAKLLGEFL